MDLYAHTWHFSKCPSDVEDSETPLWGPFSWSPSTRAAPDRGNQASVEPVGMARGDPCLVSRVSREPTGSEDGSVGAGWACKVLAFPFRAFSLLVNILGHFLFYFFPPFEKLSHAGILCLEILENRVSSGMRDALRFIYGLHASVMGKGSFIML